MSGNVSEDLRSEKKFVVRDIPDKGKGIVAIKVIDEGELILAESPLFTVPWWVRTGVYPRFVLTLLTWEIFDFEESLSLAHLGENDIYLIWCTDSSL